MKVVGSPHPYQIAQRAATTLSVGVAEQAPGELHLEAMHAEAAI